MKAWKLKQLQKIAIQTRANISSKVCILWRNLIVSTSKKYFKTKSLGNKHISTIRHMTLSVL